MPQIAVINESATDDDEVAWACKAVDAQLREDFCPRWLTAPYQPVSFFTSPKDLPVASGLSIIFSIVDRLDTPGLAAYHSFLGVPFVKIDRNQGALGTLLSHEAMEEIVNPTCTKTFLMPDDRVAAYEPADPVQGWTYWKDVELFGEKSQVPVSAFVLPRWFYPPELAEPGETYFCLGRTDQLAPRTIAPGGYVPVLLNGVWDAVFGSRVTPEEQRARRAKWAANPTGRAARRTL